MAEPLITDADLLQVLDLARRLDTPWCLVGGIAMSAWVDGRYTRDVDIAVTADDDAAAEAVVRSAQDLGWSMFALLEHERTDRVATVRLRSPKDLVLDLLFASCGIEPEVVAEAAPVPIVPGHLVPVARPGHLVAMKLLSVSERRYKDAQDLVDLLSDIDDAELARAEAAAALIMARGAARHKDLPADLQTWLARARG